MKCPACPSNALVVLELDRIEVDYCPECKGIWLDAGELELLFGNEQACRDFLSIGSPANSPQNEPIRACPLCDASMTKESTTGGHAVIFDHCPNSDGIWFDAGELEAVLTHGDALEGNKEVVNFLREIFPQ